MKPQASDGKNRWIKAQVEQQVDVRSYAVRAEDGRLFRRNRRHLRQSREPFGSKDADVEISSPILNCPPTESNKEQAPTEKSAGHRTSSKQTDPGPQAQTTRPGPQAKTTRPASPAYCHKSSALTRSGRPICPPSYLKGYVTT